MSPLKKTQLRQSEVRSRIKEISELSTEEITPEIRSELNDLKQESAALETLYQSQILAQDDPEEGTLPAMDPEARERENLRQRCSLLNYLTGYKRGKIQGAELEYREDAGYGEGHIPLSLFDEPVPADPEARAITAAPSTVGLNMRPIVPSVFAQSVASELMIEMPQVGSGTHTETIMNADLTAGWEAVSSDATATAATFSQKSTTPHRLSAALEIAMETSAAVGIPAFEASLRTNLMQVFSSVLDTAILRGSASSDTDSINGLITNLTQPTAESDTDTFSSLITKIANQIDGIWARNLTDVGVLLNLDVIRWMLNVWPAAAQVTHAQESIYDYAKSRLSSVTSSSRMAGHASNVSTILFCKKAKADQRRAVMPHWGSIEVADIYSLSPRGQTRYLMHALVGDCLILNSGAYDLVSIKTA